MSQYKTSLVRIAQFAAATTIFIGLVIVSGWQFRIPLLRFQAFGTFVAPNTALCFICCGVSVLLQLSGGRKRQWLGQFLGVLVTFFALATGFEYLSGINLGIDGLFMAHRLSDWFLPLPGRFTVNTVIGFTAAGLSLITLRRISKISWSEVFAAVVFLVSYLSLVAYLFGASVLYDHVMSPHTAALFAILAVALMVGSKQKSFLGVLLSPFAGAIASRKMISAIFLILPAFGAVELWAERSGHISLQLGTSLAVIASTTVFTILALRTAAVLNETDRRRADTELALRKSGQIAAVGRMAATIAHEINNPLEAITNIVYLLKSSDMTEEERRAFLDIAERELSRVSAIARRTLGFYREESLETEFDASELVDGVLEIFRAKLGTNITVRKNYQPNARMSGRAGEVRQVLSNLVANAIDALQGEQGILDLSVTVLEGHVSIEVRDNGEGISKEHLSHIFDPFFTTKKEYGTGLGLWVSRELVTKNNGIIRVASSTAANNHGSTFQVTFPSVKRAQLTPNLSTGVGRESAAHPDSLFIR